MTRWSITVGDCLAVMRTLQDNSIDAVLTDPPYELGFMGKKWDATGIAFNVDVWREALRVLKPGGHLLAFGGTRTEHRLTCAIEDAGFDIRDKLAWFYATGFPKSLDVSRAIDDAAGVERPQIGVKAVGMGNARGPAGNHDGGPEGLPVTAPVTPAAQQWDGWGTALKPAWEPVPLARKPLEGTVAENVQRWGTGALNIDGCRIGLDVVGWGGSPTHGYQDGWANTEDGRPAAGRFPANLLLDDGAAALLDAQSGELSSGGYPPEGTQRTQGVATGAPNRAGPQAFTTSTGGASRFFFVAKPDRTERDAGCDDLPISTGGEATDREDDSAGLSSPRAGAGRGGGARNIHPTVKPITVMRYLARLITPPGGRILDPFFGSGSTGCGAILEGFSVDGIDLETAHCAIAWHRMTHWESRTIAPGAKAVRAQAADPRQIKMF